MKLFVILLVAGTGVASTSLFGQAGGAAEEHRPIATADAPRPVPGDVPRSDVVVLPSVVSLNGIANLDYKCALLTIQTPGQPKMSVVIKEGEMKAAVHVLQVNTTNARVLVRIGEETRLLSLSGLESTTAPATDPEHVPIVAVTDSGER